MERASKVFPGSAADKGTYVVLELSLSAEALAHFTKTLAGVRHHFASMLHKRTYPDGIDWKVCHFCGDFPLGHFGVREQWHVIM